jgi:hypothetical protein
MHLLAALVLMLCLCACYEDPQRPDPSKLFPVPRAHPTPNWRTI